MSYIDIKKVLSFQNLRINIFEGAVNFCKIIIDNSCCNKGNSNKNFTVLKSKIENVIEQIYYLSNDAQILLPKLPQNEVKDDLEHSKDAISKTFQ